MGRTILLTAQDIKQLPFYTQIIGVDYVVVVCEFDAAPTGVPLNVIVVASFTNITAFWDEIECIERNGLIISYSVDFREVAGQTTVHGEIVGRSFVARELTEGTAYSFRVAGVNVNDTGPFSETIFIQTIRGEHSGTSDKGPSVKGKK